MAMFRQSTSEAAMHGMICKSLESFLRQHHGEEAWQAVRRTAELDFDGFETMRLYPDTTLGALVAAATSTLGIGATELLEDIGTWLCTAPDLSPVRRLVRFSGPTYEDLIWTMDDLRERGRLAVPDLELPDCSVSRDASGTFLIDVRWVVDGGAAVLTGMLRAMADDYGTLALIDAAPMAQGPDGLWHSTVRVSLVDAHFQAPREFVIGRVE
jgi:hypothetical protein